MQFNLRTLLVAFAALSLPLAWVAYNANLVRQRQALRRLLDSGERGWEIAIVQDGTFPVEVPWIRQVMGDWPAAGFSWNPDADNERSFLKRMHRLFPEAKIISSDGTTAMDADKSLRQRGAWSAPHPRFLKQGR